MQKIHFKAPNCWINDPNGFIWYQGQYHLFYQCFPYAPQWGRMHWGHAVSKDLVNWEEKGIALYPTKTDDRSGCFSGSAVEQDGTMYLYYTGVNYLEEDPENINHCRNDQFLSAQMMISSADGMTFDNLQEKKTIIPTIAEDKIGSKTHTRDPKVWRGTDAWYMVLGSSVAHKGRLLIYQSRDLQNWKYLSHVEKDNFGWMWECPDYSQDVLMLMLHASSLGLPFLPVRLMQGSGLMKFWGISEEKRKTMPKIENLKCAEIENPMVPGQKVVAVPVPKIDTAIIHVQQASPDGTCIIMGDEFHDIDIAIAARKTIVTCEEIVSDEFIRRDPTKTRIFGECVQAVVKAPYGAWPAQCYDYYDDDDAGLKEYDKASKYQDAEDAVKQLEKAAAKAAKALEKAPEDEKLKLAAENAQKAFELAKSGEKIPETFKDFLEKWVYSCEDQSALLDKLGGSRLMRLKNEPHLGYSTTH